MIWIFGALLVSPLLHFFLHGIHNWSRICTYYTTAARLPLPCDSVYIPYRTIYSSHQFPVNNLSSPTFLVGRRRDFFHQSLSHYPVCGTVTTGWSDSGTMAAGCSSCRKFRGVRELIEWRREGVEKINRILADHNAEILALTLEFGGDYISPSQGSRRYTDSQGRNEGMESMETNSKNPLQTAHTEIFAWMLAESMETNSKNLLQTAHTEMFAGTPGSGSDYISSSQGSRRYTHFQAHFQAGNGGIESMETNSKNLLQTAHTEILAGTLGSGGDSISSSQNSRRYTHFQAGNGGIESMETNSKNPLQTAHNEHLTGSLRPIDGNQHSALQQTESRSNLDTDTEMFAGTLESGGDYISYTDSQGRNEGMESMETNSKNPFQTAHIGDLVGSSHPINGNQHSTLQQTESRSNLDTLQQDIPSLSNSTGDFGRDPKSPRSPQNKPDDQSWASAPLRTARSPQKKTESMSNSSGNSKSRRRKLCLCPIKGCHSIFMRSDYLRNHLRNDHHIPFEKGVWARKWMSKPENEGEFLAAVQRQAQENDLISSCALEVIGG